jgi:thioesterase domain-containing protein/acyl carrier protein
MSSKEQPANLSDIALEKELLGMWRRALKNDNLTIDDDFFECGGDSLLAIELLLEIEILAGKILSDSIIFETGTVRQLSKRVIETDKVNPQVFVLIGSANGKIIHYFHGDFDYGGFGIKTFSKMIGPDYLIHSIAPHLLHEGKLPDSIEDMAKERLSKILEKQPNGPYILFGSCNGALVAFEVARELILMGKEVKAVVMIDPVIMSVKRFAHFIFMTADFLMRLAGLHKNERRRHLIWIWSKLVLLDARTKDMWRRVLFFLKKTWPQKRTSLKKLLESIDRLLNTQTPGHESREREIIEHYSNALFNYKPSPLTAPVLYMASQYSGHAWQRITREMVYLNRYRGNHSPWVKEDSQEIVNKIREFITR